MKQGINGAHSLPHHKGIVSWRRLHRLYAHRILWVFIVLSIILGSCGGNWQRQPQSGKAQKSKMITDTATHGKTMDMLLEDYDHDRREQRIVTANKIFGILDRDELTDSLLQVSLKTHPDTIDLLVWYWGEYYYAQQNYAKGLSCTKKALPLAEQNHDLTLKSDCENLTGLFYFRMSNYAQALRHTRKSLEYDRRTGDKGRIS